MEARLCIDDVRFPNEALAVRCASPFAMVVRVARTEAKSAAVPASGARLRAAELSRRRDHHE
jgi:hypothetical protein